VLTTDAPKEQIPLVEVLGKTLETYPENETHLWELGSPYKPMQVLKIKY
jgi:hypothetical protein